MIITSTEAAHGFKDNRPATLEDSLCETCDSPVDLTTSVLMKGRRVVGCPACDWIPHAAAAAAPRAASPST